MKTTPSPLKQAGKLLILTRRDEEILRAFHFYRFMTALDVTHLFFSPKSLNHVQEMLSRLSEGGDGQTDQYLYRFTLPTIARESERI